MNYLMLNDKKIELTAEQAEEIKSSFGFDKTALSDVVPGETIKVGDLEFIVLEHHEETTSIILKDFWKTSQFDSSCNNYSKSEIRKDLNTDFYKELSDCVGKDNIVKHTVDLTADDGRTDYKECEDNISLLTCNMYRKYVYILEHHNPQNWWWLATPYSTESNGYTTTVCCVDDGGTLSSSSCGGFDGVRPFCILKSNIFVSK